MGELGPSIHNLFYFQRKDLLFSFEFAVSSFSEIVHGILITSAFHFQFQHQRAQLNQSEHHEKDASRLELQRSVQLFQLLRASSIFFKGVAETENTSIKVPRG